LIFKVFYLVRLGLIYIIGLGALAVLASCGSESSSSSNDGNAVNCVGGVASPSGSLVSYSLVSVGNSGNADDANGFGAVSYTFNMGKYNVTIAQYTAFLNAVAKTDPNGLYDSRMATDLNVAGIARSIGPGTSGYVYTAMNNSGDSSNRPIAYVSWFNAARFANWMSNNQPVGPQSSTTTENGAYDLSKTINEKAVAKNICNPNTGKSVAYWIPTENEWYKAAYYSPNYNDMGSSGYYLYSTQSDASPGNLVGNTSNQMNVIINLLFSVTQAATLELSQNYLTDVGAYTGSPSYYGTFDQNGSLYQWNDLDGTQGAYRGIRGSFWFAGAQAAQSITYAATAPTFAGNDIGFRLAATLK